MNKKSMFTAFTLKALLVIISLTVGFTSFTKCQAQSIVGKWKGVSVKYFYNPEYAKQVGKSEEEKFQKDIGYSEGEYKSDHTFTIRFSAPKSSDVTIMKGTWSLSGDQLKSTLESKYNPRNTTSTATVSIKGNTMVTTSSLIPPPSRIAKTISTSTRM